MRSLKRVWLLVMSLLLSAGVALSLAGCSGHSSALGAAARAACEEVGWCEPTVDPPELLDVLFDTASRRAVTEDHVGEVLDHILPRMVLRRPGSALRIWALGETDGDLRLLGKLKSPLLIKKSSRSSVRKEQEGWLREARAQLMAAVVPVVEAPASEKTSLAAALARAALADGDGGERMPRTLIMVSDGADPHSLGRLGCSATFRNDDGVLYDLPYRRWLTGTVLKGFTVYWAYFSPESLPGCPPATAISRDMTRTAWDIALTQSGIASGVFWSGPPHFQDEPYWGQFRWLQWLPGSRETQD